MLWLGRGRYCNKGPSELSCLTTKKDVCEEKHTRRNNLRADLRQKEAYMTEELHSIDWKLWVHQLLTVLQYTALSAYQLILPYDHLTTSQGNSLQEAVVVDTFQSNNLVRFGNTYTSLIKQKTREITESIFRKIIGFNRTLKPTIWRNNFPFFGFVLSDL